MKRRENSLTFSSKDLSKRAAVLIHKRAQVETRHLALILGSAWAKGADLLGETIAEIAADEVPGSLAREFSATPGQSDSFGCQAATMTHCLVLGRTYAKTGALERKFMVRAGRLGRDSNRADERWWACGSCRGRRCHHADL